ncbi:hypothetical protein BDQ17DRAFT_1436830 [Cyathus striatus]|nr:hypothetical protein BDQ17DRAFT_1436830 [Cyathus striatus]
MSIPLVPKSKIPETFSGKYGSLLIATMVNANAYGFALIMVVRYFGLYSTGDSALTKGVVSLLIHQVFDYFILKFGRSELFNGISSVALAKYLSAFFTAFVAQIDQIHAVETATTYAPSYFSGNIANGSRFNASHYHGHAGTFEKLASRKCFFQKVVITQGISTAICDVAITASFSFVFYSNRSGIRSRTHSILNRFIIYAIHRAAATSVCSIIGVFTYYFLSGTYIYMIPVLGNTDLHVISVVSVLTARGSLREEDYSLHLSNIEIPSIVGGSNTIPISVDNSNVRRNQSP